VLKVPLNSKKTNKLAATFDNFRIKFDCPFFWTVLQVEADLTRFSEERPLGLLVQDLFTGQMPFLLPDVQRQSTVSLLQLIILSVLVSI